MTLKEVEIKPIHPEEQAKVISAGLQKQKLKGAVPKIIGLGEKQQQISYLIAAKVRELPGIEARPQMTKTLDEIIKTKGDAILSAKALVNEKEQIYSLEISMKNKPIILTISIDDKNNSTAILLTDKNGKIIEGFYNQSKA